LFNTIVFILFLLFFSSLSISLVRIKIKNYKLLEQILSANIEKALLAERLEKELLKTSGNIDQEGFVNFLSQSRDWAFEYIETVQKELTSFRNVVDGIFKNFNDGKVTDLNLAINTIFDSYQQLMQNLPTDDDRTTDTREII
jgi:hypothetical protein